MASDSSGWGTWIVLQVVWVLFWAFMLIVGVLMPAAGVLAMFNAAGTLSFNPGAPELLGRAALYVLGTAAAIMVLGKVGFARYGFFLAYFLAGLFACAFIAALMFSTLVGLVLHAVVSPLLGIDAWVEWRPAVHAFFAALGVPWAFSICWQERRDLLDAGSGTASGSDSFRRTPRRARASAGSAYGDASDAGGWSGGGGGGWSGGGAGGAWGDSPDGGGDSD